MTFLTGLRRRSEEVAHLFASTRAYSNELAAPETVIQSVLRIHKQPLKPSCVGETITEIDEAVDGIAKSGVDTWLDSRRRQGDLFNPNVGTDFAHGIASLCGRGCSAYVPGEETRPREEDVRLPTLGQDEAADDDRQDPKAEHKTLTTNRHAQACDALVRGLGLAHGGPINDMFMALERDEVIEPKHVAGDEGHERRIFGYVKERGLYLEQESYDLDFAGVTLPRGLIVPAFSYCGISVPAGPLANDLFLPGAAWLSPEAYALSWDSDTLKIKTA
jgi:hypothetical protein